MCTPHDSLLDFRARGEHSVPVTRRCQWAARQHPGGDGDVAVDGLDRRDHVARHSDDGAERLARQGFRRRSSCSIVLTRRLELHGWFGVRSGRLPNGLGLSLWHIACFVPPCRRRHEKQHVNTRYASGHAACRDDGRE